MRREAFPRARWSDRLNAWFLPGRTAERRIGRWLAAMEREADVFANEKGRDAFAFDPIESRYLEAAPATFQIRTPYSRTVIDEIREIPHARWGADCRLWTVPYRSFEELRQRWPAIEAAAQRSEPEARRARRAAIKGTEEGENLGWFGKRFTPDMRADALLFRSGDRRLVAFDPAWIPLRLALRFHGIGRARVARSLFFYLQRRLRAKGPVASLKAMVFAGVESAAMVYDEQPIVDHFRRVDEDRVMGAMKISGDERIYFFELERVDGP